MARKTYTVRTHKDGTVTFRSGRHIEHIDIRFIGYLETYERLKLAALTAGFSLNQATLEELLREARGLKGVDPPKGPAGKKIYVRVPTEKYLGFLIARGRNFTRVDEIASRFNVSMQTANRHLAKLVTQGKVEKNGTLYRVVQKR